MRRVIGFLKRNGLSMSLFGAGLLLFNWPLLSLAVDKGNTAIFTYLMVTWAVIVILVAVIGLAIRHSNKTDGEE